MAKAKRGMDAVLAKTGKVGRPRKAALLRKGAKGPGLSIMIAVGKPKMGAPDAKAPDAEAPAKPEGKLAALEARIAELEAQLAAMDADHAAMKDADEGEDADADEDEAY